MPLTYKQKINIITYIIDYGLMFFFVNFIVIISAIRLCDIHLLIHVDFISPIFFAIIYRLANDWVIKLRDKKLND